MERRYVLENHLFILVFVCFGPLLSASDLSPGEKNVMLELSRLFSSSLWNTTNPDPCKWNGVLCDNASISHVTRLSLSGIGFTTITSSSDDLLRLPCGLESLQSLDLSKNLLTSIPNNFTSDCNGLKGLQLLNLSNNMLSGPLPSFSELGFLESLDLSSNHLEGVIDSQFADSNALRSLNLTQNNFTGAVPVRLCRGTALQELQLSQNYFTGPIPQELFNHTNLTLLNLSANKINGSIPGTIVRLSKLSILVLSANQLSGELPPTLSNMTFLSRFAANQNNLTGTIPPGITRNLRNLDLSYNHLEGLIPVDLLSYQNLVSVDLSYNRLEGPIPKKISQNLSRLRLTGNSLNDTIPSSIGMLSELTYLELDENNLTGGIPEELMKCANLSLLNLAKNYLDGALPKQLGNLNRLVVLKLQMNHFRDSIPAEVSQLRRLITLNLSDNSLAGQIPSSISALQNLSILNLQRNQLTGQIPNGIDNLQSLMELSLGDNHLNAPIPTMPRSLAILNLTSNNFSGKIKDSFSNSQWPPLLEILDLSNNRFTGEVPSILSQIKSLTYLVLTNNQLSGTLPKFDVRVKIDTTGNKDLNLLEPNASVNPKKKEISILMIVIVSSASVVIATGIVAAFLKFIASRRFSHENISQIITSHVITTNRIHKSRINIRKSMEAVCNPNNVFQKTKCSTYYKAVMPRGMSYCVKKLNWSEKMFHRGSYEKFGTEVENLSKLINPNILIPLAYVITVDFAYLIYENEHKGTIWDFLHGGAGHFLDWPARYSIALSVAKGMAHLHGCEQQIVLVDLSTKSIFLKSVKEPLIDDIELCRVIDPSKGAGSVSIVACAVGYAPPEYAYTMRVTKSGNVYSFGVVLLELLTGRQPVSEGIELAKWASRYSINDREHILDSIVSKSSILVRSQMLSVLKVALDCVNWSPEARPDMMNVIDSLLHSR